MRGRGFTVIEMLTVVAVIAVLVALLSPSLQKSLDSARLVHCGNNLRQVYLQYQMYAESFHGFYPPVRGDYFVKESDTFPVDAHHDGVVNVQVFIQGVEGRKHPSWICPVDTQPEHQITNGDLRQVSYGENRFAWEAACPLKVRGGGADHDIAGYRAMRPQRLPKKFGLAGTIMMIERKGIFPHGYLNYSRPQDSYLTEYGRTTADWDNLMYRHCDNTRMNMLFFDGHVSSGHYMDVREDLKSMRFEFLW